MSPGKPVNYVVTLLVFLVSTFVPPRFVLGLVSYTCEGYTTTLKCPAGATRIHIETDSYYGRRDKLDSQQNKGVRYCPHESVTRDHECTDRNVTHIRKKCDGRRACMVMATFGPLGFLGDPCLDIFKYMKVTWTCIDVSSNSTTHNTTQADTNPKFTTTENSNSLDPSGEGSTTTVLASKISIIGGLAILNLT